MAFKYLCIAAMVAVARAAVISPYPIAGLAAPVTVAHAGPAVAVARTVESYDPNPQYSYAYDVQDGLTGDSKTQHESRDGDVVRGSYSLVEADGTRRVVNYVADPINGFNAVVHKEPAVVRAAIAASPVAVAAAPVAVAPVAVAHAPISIAQPVAVARPVAVAGPIAVAKPLALGHGPLGYGIGYSGLGVAQAPLGAAYH